MCVLEDMFERMVSFELFFLKLGKWQKVFLKTKSERPTTTQSKKKISLRYNDDAKDDVKLFVSVKLFESASIGNINQTTNVGCVSRALRLNSVIN